MLPQTVIPLSRSASESSDPGSATSVVYYTRSDQPCMLSFRVGDTVWARSDGVWALGIIVSDGGLLQNQNGGRSVPTYTVLTRADSPSTPGTLAILSPLFGSLKPADAYTAALLRAEGLFPHAGTDRADVLDLRVKAHAFINMRMRDAKLQSRLR